MLIYLEIGFPGERRKLQNTMRAGNTPFIKKSEPAAGPHQRCWHCHTHVYHISNATRNDRLQSLGGGGNPSKAMLLVMRPPVRIGVYPNPKRKVNSGQAVCGLVCWSVPAKTHCIRPSNADLPGSQLPQ